MPKYPFVLSPTRLKLFTVVDLCSVFCSIPRSQRPKSIFFYLEKLLPNWTWVLLLMRSKAKLLTTDCSEGNYIYYKENRWLILKRLNSPMAFRGGFFKGNFWGEGLLLMDFWLSMDCSVVAVLIIKLMVAISLGSMCCGHNESLSFTWVTVLVSTEQLKGMYLISIYIYLKRTR